jgi:PucR C-terminal helix-turn-helix domain/GGDEF-like domain
MSDNDGGSLDSARAELAGRLRARRSALVQLIFARMRDATFSKSGQDDAEYVEGLRAAVIAAVDYSLEGIERGEEWAAPIPPVASAQARRAARAGVPLDTVLRRYVVGNALLGEFIMEETDRSELPSVGGGLRAAMRAQGAVLDRLLEAITREYGDELDRAVRSPERRRRELVRKLLDGTSGERTGLGYELDAFHLGLIATGPGGGRVLRELAGKLDRRLLCVEQHPHSVWAWIGGAEPAGMDDVRRLGDTALTTAGLSVILAVGEPAWGLDGWRLTHQQAQAAVVVALRRPQPLTRYGEVALLATALKDELLGRGLIDIYLTPLDAQRDKGTVLRRTLRAYLAAGRNASSAAAALGIARNTLIGRLRTVEESLDRPLAECLPELEVALRLEEIESKDTGGKK